MIRIKTEVYFQFENWRNLWRNMWQTFSSERLCWMLLNSTSKGVRVKYGQDIWIIYVKLTYFDWFVNYLSIFTSYWQIFRCFFTIFLELSYDCKICLLFLFLNLYLICSYVYNWLFYRHFCVLIKFTDFFILFPSIS